MKDSLSSSAQKVQRALAAHGLDYSVVEMTATTRTAKDAASAIGCTVSQIVKSLVFRTVRGGEPILVLASGANRVNEEQIGSVLGTPIERADANYVLEATGFAIGGVPPLGHSRKIETLIDTDLMTFDVIWAAAGTPNAVFRVSPQDLHKLTNGRIVQIT
jgi:prolyl-tRNA editing enzyme YbaK/EbsC (Cys-tRNA(Pro) deacylase)